jgi:hypothetical protein
MRALCILLQSKTVPQIKSLQIKKVVSLLSASEGNLALFKDIEVNAQSVKDMIGSALNKDKGTSSFRDLSDLLPHLSAITSSETGLETHPDELYASCEAVLDEMRGVISNEDEAAADNCTVDVYKRIPADFFTKYEEAIRGKLSRKCLVVNALYEEIESAASDLMAAVQKDYPLTAEIKHDIPNSVIFFTEKKKKGKKVDPTIDSDSESDNSDEGVAGKKLNFIHPICKKNKPMYQKYTTKEVNDAVAHYLQVTERFLEVTEQGENCCDMYFITVKSYETQCVKELFAHAPFLCLM